MGLPLWGEGRRGKGMAEEASVLINHIVLPFGLADLPLALGQRCCPPPDSSHSTTYGGWGGGGSSQWDLTLFP